MMRLTTAACEWLIGQGEVPRDNCIWKGVLLLLNRWAAPVLLLQRTIANVSLLKIIALPLYCNALHFALLSIFVHCNVLLFDPAALILFLTALKSSRVFSCVFSQSCQDFWQSAWSFKAIPKVKIIARDDKTWKKPLPLINNSNITNTIKLSSMSGQYSSYVVISFAN